MTCEVTLTRRTYLPKDSSTDIYPLEEQVLWNGYGAELGIRFCRLMKEQTRREVELEELQAFCAWDDVRNEEVVDDLEDLQKVLTEASNTDSYSLDDTFFVVELDY